MKNIKIAVDNDKTTDQIRNELEDYINRTRLFAEAFVMAARAPTETQVDSLTDAIMALEEMAYMNAARIQRISELFHDMDVAYRKL